MIENTFEYNRMLEVNNVKLVTNDDTGRADEYNLKRLTTVGSGNLAGKHVSTNARLIRSVFP